MTEHILNIGPSILIYTLKILSLGVLFDTMWVLKNRKHYSSKGIFPYYIHLYSKSIDSKIMVLLKPLMRYPHFIYIMIVRMLLAGFIIVFVNQVTEYTYILVLGMLLLQLLFNLRNRVNLSGADQMITIFLFGLTFVFLDLTKLSSLIAMTFIVVHQFLAYFFTGYHKLRSPLWRDGYGLILAMNSESFGNQKIVNFLKVHKGLNLCLSWSAILFQLFFPFWVLLHPTLSIIILLIGVLFHLSVSVVMNLNNFFWTFVSTYPFLYFLSKTIWLY